MTNINYIIVDDSPLIHERLEELLAIYPYLKKTGDFYDAINTQVYLLEDTPNLILLDIEMPGISGIDLLKILDKKINVIINLSSI